jgi:hypothetical protein
VLHIFNPYNGCITVIQPVKRPKLPHPHSKSLDFKPLLVQITFKVDLPTIIVQLIMLPKLDPPTSSSILFNTSYTSSMFRQQVNLPNPSDCTLKTCPLVETGVIYMPSVAPNVLYLTLFVLLLLAHFVQGARYKTWDIFGIMAAAMSLEMVGYTARVCMHIGSYAKKMLTMF